MIPEQILWQSVVYKALIDATALNPYGREDRLAKFVADRWFRLGGRDYREVCALAGVDSDFIRDNYMAGKIDGKLLRAKESEMAPERARIAKVSA